MNAQAQAAKEVAARRRRTRTALMLSVALTGWSLFAASAHLHTTAGTWRNDPAPKVEPLYVVTKAYVDRDGNWRSMDNGERITVTHWTHQGLLTWP